MKVEILLKKITSYRYLLNLYFTYIFYMIKFGWKFEWSSYKTMFWISIWCAKWLLMYHINIVYIKGLFMNKHFSTRLTPFFYRYERNGLHWKTTRSSCRVRKTYHLGQTGETGCGQQHSGRMVEWFWFRFFYYYVFIRNIKNKKLFCHTTLICLNIVLLTLMMQKLCTMLLLAAMNK